MKRHSAPLSQDLGFTLVELLVVMAISAVLLTATFTAFIGHENVTQRARQTITNREDARAALHMMATEVQMTGFAHLGGTNCITNRTTVAAGAAFTTAAAGTLGFSIRKDLSIPVDGDCDDPGEQENITYAYDAANSRITRNTGGGPQPFLDNVTALSFQYWCATSPTADPNGPVAAYLTAPCNDGTRIVRVDVSITVQNRKVSTLAVGTGETRPTQTFSTSIIPRNMFVI